MILIVDNYDSFTFNLVQFIGELGADPLVYRNDALSIEEARRLEPRGAIISPGPGRPEAAGVSVELVRALGPGLPILGVCLGHQAVAVAFGGQVGRAPLPVHGKTARVTHDDSALFEGVANPFEAGRYHSLVALRDSLPAELTVSCATVDGLVMGVRHDRWPIHGVQFHPESILTQDGKTLLKNFLLSCGEIS